jgi:hypothetical protein
MNLIAALAKEIRRPIRAMPLKAQLVKVSLAVSLSVAWRATTTSGLAGKNPQARRANRAGLCFNDAQDAQLRFHAGDSGIDAVSRFPTCPGTKWFAASRLDGRGPRKAYPPASYSCRLSSAMTYRKLFADGTICPGQRYASFLLMREPDNTKLGGGSTTVEIDETYVGGVKRGAGVFRGKLTKQAVLGIAERERFLGRIHLQIIRDKSQRSILPVLNDKLEAHKPRK